jgi:hypothetical protein
MPTSSRIRREPSKQAQRLAAIARHDELAEQARGQAQEHPGLIGGHFADRDVAAQHVQGGAGGETAARDQGAGPGLLEAARHLHRLLQL